jgi:hypothetical protein
MESRIPDRCHCNDEETTKKPSTPIQAHSVTPARSFAPVARTLLTSDNCEPWSASSPSACGTDRGKQTGRIGVRDNCCAIIKPANVIPKYLEKMLWRELAREGRV